MSPAVEVQHVSSQVISAVTRVDERGQFISEQRGLMEKFASHTELGEECVGELQNWVASEASCKTELALDLGGAKNRTMARPSKV